MKKFLTSLLLMVCLMPFTLRADEVESRFFSDFTNGSMEGWKTVDVDNDGQCWLGHTEGYFYSVSSESLKPNNILSTTSRYAIYPTSKITFDVKSDKELEKHGIGVAYSLDGTNFITIQDETVLDSTNLDTITGWHNVEISLNYIANKEVYIGILHYTMDDQGTIMVDNVKLTDGLLTKVEDVAATDNDSLVNVSWRWEDEDSDEPVGYRVYRNRINANGTAVMIGDNVTDTTFQDTLWSEQEWGIYQWGVAALYEQETRGTADTLLEEGFETTEYPNLPEGWTTFSEPTTAATAGAWRATNSVYTTILAPDAGSNFAFSSGANVNATHYLVTPVLNLARALNPVLTFKYAAPGQFDSNGNTLYVKCAESAEGPWTELWSETSNGQWKSATIDLSAYAGRRIYVAFVHEDIVGGHFGIGLDNISIKSELSETALPIASRIAWSNPIEKDMNTVVKFTVATDDNVSAIGAIVTLENTNESQYKYEGTADSTGLVQFSAVRRGDYKYTVSLDKYYSYEGTIAVYEEVSAGCILEKMPEVMEGLYVSPTAWAMWDYATDSTTFDILLNDEIVEKDFSGKQYQFETTSLVEGQEYKTTILPKDQYVMLEYTWEYVKCSNFANAVNFKTTKQDSTVVLTWDMPTYEAPQGPAYDFSVNFDNGTLEGWTTIDADGDLENWKNTAEFGYEGFGVGGTYCATSFSYATEADKPLTPNNFLVSDRKYTITENSKLTFSIAAQSKQFPNEHYGVAISTTSNKDAADFTVIFDETLTAGVVDSISTQGQWFERTVDLSQYAGQEIYIAFRHYESADNFWIKLDDISLTSGMTRGDREEGEWLYYDNGVYESAAGNFDMDYNPTQIYWAIMFPAELIADYAKRPITKVAMYDLSAHAGAFSIHEGGDIAPGNMVHVQTYETTGTGSYIELELDTPVTISGKENVWIQFSNEYGSGDYVAAYSADMGDPNSRWRSDNGSLWYDSNWFGEGWYGTWMIRAFVGEKDESIVEEPETSTFTTLGTIIYRNGELITPKPIKETTYTDDIIGEDDVEYSIRVVYDGEKDQSYYAMSCPLTKIFSVKEEIIEDTLACPRPENLYGELTYKEDSVFGATLTWPYTTRDGELDHYNIYRSTTNDNYQLIGNTKENTYFDTIVEKGTYYYQVTAVYTRGEEICESEPATAYGNPEANYVVIEVTKIDENGVNGLMVYPNPAKDNLNIVAENMRRITICNVLGQVVYDRNVDSDNEIINMSQYEAGIYMVRIATENGVAVKRISVAK